MLFQQALNHEFFFTIQKFSEVVLNAANYFSYELPI